MLQDEKGELVVADFSLTGIRYNSYGMNKDGAEICRQSNSKWGVAMHPAFAGCKAMKGAAVTILVFEQCAGIPKNADGTTGPFPSKMYPKS